MPDEDHRRTTVSGSGPPRLDPDMRVVYGVLLEHGGDLDAARPVIGPEVDVDGALERLAALRLVHRAGGGRYEAVSPTEAAEDLVGPREADAYERLRQAVQLRTMLRELAPLYRTAAGSRLLTAGAELLYGSDEVGARLDELSAGIRRSVASAHPTMASPEVLKASLEADGRLLARGIAYRQLFTHTALRYHQSLAYLQTMQRQGAEVRTASIIPNRIILIDDDHAIIPVVSGEASAAVVKDPSVLAYLHQIFDFLWERGRRIEDEAVGDERVPREVELAILQELAAGRTDEAIARRLGISSRTLRRYLSGMLESFGVDTRFQLGMAFVRQGLDDTGDTDPPA
ncbi:helix-turn-helix transcriptional regulator [Phycicoccus flavus]|uniref:Helix-turn-helix transcriptional regulator n=1 Tax=Phycicoccus flavus TaxID=2502783 RepID=A0A8T6R4J2_9MICO|nr:helix-turn-helix domain-containing protein [Phycicoccus flavus]NHA67715.1 helix-turn-helix transcriptional regulator [Phycicoccus flavus]